jgi:hypothetical protein
MFVKAVNAQAQAIKEFIDRKIAALHAPKASNAGSESLADQIGKLAVLKRDGVLSEEEFAAAKTKLLG